MAQSDDESASGTCRHESWDLQNLRPPSAGDAFDASRGKLSAEADCTNCGATLLLEAEINEVFEL